MKRILNIDKDDLVTSFGLLLALTGIALMSTTRVNADLVREGGYLIVLGVIFSALGLVRSVEMIRATIIKIKKKRNPFH